MQIIKNRRIIESEWRLEGGGGGGDADAAGPDATDAGDIADAAGSGAADDDAHYDHRILSLTRWRELRATPALSGKAIGVLLRPEDPVEAIAADLAAFSLIALDFGSFREGRGYTQAAELRRHHFRGEIRALGAHRDNLPLMERCGIDAYQLADGEDLADALAAFDEITEYYPLNQPARAGAG
ncbi:MAG: DUF934 domain-containing protein [Gammaproteobacteria bacterium]